MADKQCVACKEWFSEAEFASTGAKYKEHTYATRKCRACYNADKRKEREQRQNIAGCPKMVIYDQSNRQYVEYAPVRAVKKPAKQVDKVLQFVAHQGVLVFKMKLRGQV